MPLRAAGPSLPDIAAALTVQAEEWRTVHPPPVIECLVA